MDDAIELEKKLKRLMNRAKRYIFINAAISDEVVKLQDKITKAVEERNYLIHKLLQKQPTNHGTATRKVTEVTGHKSSSKGGSTHPRKRKPPAKKVVHHDDDDEYGEDNDNVAPKKKARQNFPKKATLAPLDPSGRPIFPIEIGSLTVYSIGEIITSPNYHSPECIYPIGYCSTRLYVSINPGVKTCLYTCKVTDVGDRPQFEILPEDSPSRSFVGSTPDECHAKLLGCINSVRGAGSVPSVSSGCSFFGLTHPTLQNLIQCFPGARRCSNYNWVKFEVTKNPSQTRVEQDPNFNISLL